MIAKDWRIHAPLKSRLVGERKMMSLMEKEIAVVVGDVIEDHENWVRMWVDTGHIVSSDDGVLKAFRGIGFDGNLMWLVRHPKKKHGYHSRHQDPFDAMTEARAAWSERSRVKARWSQVQGIARDLVMGRRSFTVTREDAHRSALCGAGIDAFMTRIGAANRMTLSGRTAALLMLLEPQLGFVIYSAYERVLAEKSSANSSADGGFVYERRV